MFAALEPFVLLGGAQLMAPFERTLFGSLHRSMAALATELTAAFEPPQPPKPGAFLVVLQKHPVHKGTFITATPSSVSCVVSCQHLVASRKLWRTSTC